MSLLAWFGLSVRRWSHSTRRCPQSAAERRRQSRRLFLEGLEDRNLMAFNFLADYAVGTNPQDLALTSLNAGSQPDLAVANGDNSVGVLLGSTGGTFGPLQTAATGAGPLSLATGDLDGDSIPDMVTANASDLSLLMGNGDGSFDLALSLGLPAATPPGYSGDPLPQSPVSVATGDLNADGKLDLVVAGQTTFSVYKTGYWCGGYYGGCYPYNYWQTYEDAYVNVLLGNGTGGFSAAATQHLGSNRYSGTVAIGDLNGDTKPDVIVADNSGLSVLMNVATGPNQLALGSLQQSGSGYPLRSIALGDVDGDGKVDTLLNSGWGLSVQKGDGLGKFTAQPTVNAGIPVNSAVIGDVNGDGKLDLVAAGATNDFTCTSYGWYYCYDGFNTTTRQASVLIGNGQGGFALPLVSSFGSEANVYGYLPDVAVADVTGDSRPDLVTIDSYSGKAIVAANDGDWNPPPSIAISDAAIVVEGNSGTVNAVFTVSVVGNQHGVSVNYATADSSAAAGSDYTAKSGILTFAAGVDTMTISVPVLGDTRDEIDEQFYVNLTNAIGGVLTDSQAIGTIQDDDPAPSITINDVSKNEGNGNGNTLFAFTVTLSAASGKTVSVNYATANGTATTADNDYVATSGTIYFSPGQTTATITVQVRAGKSKEPNETFFVNLTGASNATISDSQGLATILNDDGGKGPKPRR